MSDLSDAAQATEDAIAALSARLDALESRPAQSPDLTALEARVAALEAYDASLKLVKVAEILDAIKAAVGEAVAIEGA